MHVTEQAEKLASGDSVASRSSAGDVENRMPLDVTNDLSSQVNI